MPNPALELLAAGTEAAMFPPAAERPRSSRKLAARVAGPLFVLVAAQAIVNLWLVAASVRVSGTYFAGMTLANIASWMVLGLWMTLGALPVRVQALFAAGVLVVLSGAQAAGIFFGVAINPGEAFQIVTFVQLGMFASLAAVGWYFRRVRGWRLAPGHWPHAIPPGRPLRFSLRQLFVAILVAGVVLALRTDRVPFHMTVVGLLVGFLSAVVVVPTMGLLVGTQRRRMVTLLDLGLLFVAANVTWMGIYVQRELWVVLIWYGVLAGSLLWLRICGLRLVSGTSGRPVDDSAALDPAVLGDAAGVIALDGAR